MCQHICVNSPGSYSCNCSTGFSLSSDGFSCQGLTSCLWMEYINLILHAVYVFHYLDSYERHPTDIDECESSDLNQCEEQCLNTRGSYQCNCSEGFNVSTDGFSCQGLWNVCMRYVTYSITLIHTPSYRYWWVWIFWPEPVWRAVFEHSWLLPVQLLWRI